MNNLEARGIYNATWVTGSRSRQITLNLDTYPKLKEFWKWLGEEEKA